MKAKKLRQFLRVSQAYVYGMIPFLPVPKKKFVIFGQGRTGSTLLVDLLNAEGDIRCDREIFNIFHFSGRRISNPLRYITGRSRRFPKKVYGFKVKIYQLKYDHGVRDPRGLLEALLKQGYRIVYICRDNVLQHAYSNVKRAITGVTHIRDHSNASKKMTVPVDVLMTEIRDRLRFKREEMEVIDGLPYLPVVYERDLVDSDRHLETVNRIRRYIDLDNVTQTKSRYRKITDRSLAAEISNFEEVIEALRNSELGHLADQNA